MKTQVSKTKIILMSTLALSLLAGIFLFMGKNDLGKSLNQEKIKNEKLLSEKIKLDEIVHNMKIQISSLAGKNKDLDKIIASNKTILEQKEAEIKHLLAANSSIADLKKKVNELEALKVKINEQISQLGISENNLKAENAQLNELLKTIQNENNALAVNNSILKALVADNYRVEAQKGKHEKLTLVAHRTKKLVVSFDLPAEATENLNFKVIAPNGKEFSSKNNPTSAYIKVIDNDKLMASADDILGEVSAKRTEMIYKPDVKLQRGVYKFNIYNNDTYLGSTQLRLK